MKPKALLFYTYLPPWRIDIFNEMGKSFDLTIIFLFKSPKGFEYNENLLLQKLDVKHFFLKKTFSIGSRQFHKGIIGILKSNEPDIVFSHEYSPTSIFISLLLKLKLFDFEYIITTSDNKFMTENTNIYRRVARSIVLSEADGMVVYSEEVKYWYKKNYHSLKIEVCPNIQNPVSLLSYEIQFNSIIQCYLKKFNLNGFKILLFIGRFNRVKGLELLLNAYSKVGRNDYKLILVGEGELRNSLELQAKKLGISDNVIFPGNFYGAELYTWYRLANFFILPSIFEPFGAVVNESLVFGTPVLISKHCGAINFINENYNGDTFDPLNEIDFVTKLRKAMEKYENSASTNNNLMRFDFKDYANVFSRFQST
jgi:glycosyltransferase involved in cell wall biosynthesis